MNELLSGLNPEQREVALHRGHTLAVACPGSGKTKTLATKAALLLNEGSKVGAVTFTREAALELRERIVALANPGCKSRLLVGTFHSIDMLMAFPDKFKGEFGRAILNGMKSPFEKPWNIVKEGVRRSYVIRAMREAGLNMLLDEATAIIEHVKGSPHTLMVDPEKKAMVETYLRLMDESGHIDFQDIILNTNAALKNKTLSPLGVDYLLIDEYQDTDLAQFEWSVHHGKAGIPITAVGDDDQSIYAFRRALGYEGMDRFAKEFSAARILLGTNYRCHSEILRSAEKLIQRNTQRISKLLHAAKGEGGVVQWESFNDSSSEYTAVVEEGAKVAVQENASFAVIARTNKELLAIEGLLAKEGVPHRKTDGKSIFECPEVQVYAALLRSIIKPTPNDVDQVLAWAGMTEEDTREIRKLFGNIIRVGSVVDFKNSTISKSGIDIWRLFAKKHAQWTSAYQISNFSMINEGVSEWLDETLQKPHSIDVLKVAKQMFKVYVPNDSELNAAKAAGISLKQETLDEVLAKMRSIEMNLKDESKRGNKATQDDKNIKVWLLTAHGSKGLEFDRVWIVGLNTGSFPSDKSSLEEERRLMYVAMTRAREILWVSGTKEKKPSMFVLESELISSQSQAKQILLTESM